MSRIFADGLNPSFSGHNAGIVSEMRYYLRFLVELQVFPHKVFNLDPPRGTHPGHLLRRHLEF